MDEPHDRWRAVDAYLADTLIVEDEALYAARADSAAAGLPPIEAGYSGRLTGVAGADDGRPAGPRNGNPGD